MEGRTLLLMMLTWRPVRGKLSPAVCVRTRNWSRGRAARLEEENVMAGKGGLSRLMRPVKKMSDKRRRQKVQRRRLVALGVPEEKVKKMDPVVVRTLLKRPAKLLKKKTPA